MVVSWARTRFSRDTCKWKYLSTNIFQKTQICLELKYVGIHNLDDAFNVQIHDMYKILKIHFYIILFIIIVH